MDKWNVAKALDEIARYIQISDANPFKARAFERAARAVESSPTEVADLVASGEIHKTSAIGKSIGPIVVELVETGQSGYLEELRNQYPASIFDLLGIPNLGLKKIGIIYSQLGVASLDDLETACLDGRVAKLSGFGTKTQAKILEGIGWARKHQAQFLLPTGLDAAETIRERLAAIDEVDDAEVAGSVRRRLEVIRNVNVVVATRTPVRIVREIGAILERVEKVDKSTMKGVTQGEIAVLLHLATPDDFGATMLRATGSSEFVDAFAERIRPDGYELRGNALYHRGKHVAIASEHDLFKRVGIPFVEPERREHGEDLARKKRPKLVHPSDLRGTFHVHTTFSDGRNSVREMLGASREQGLEYVGISDHSVSAGYAGGLSVDRLALQHAELSREEKQVAPMKVFRGTEADILVDGSIDYGAATLAKLDFVIASVHSRLTMPKDEMTERVLKALDDPYVTFLGHMTGRRLLAREGFTFDYDRVFERAGERGVMIEINGNPNRLDIDWRLIRRALDRGVRFSINPDAHSIREMAYVVSGTWVARKAGLSAKEIFNTRPVEEVEEHFAARRKRASTNT